MKKNLKVKRAVLVDVSRLPSSVFPNFAEQIDE